MVISFFAYQIFIHLQFKKSFLAMFDLKGSWEGYQKFL
jgi:hypothetical protein